MRRRRQGIYDKYMGRGVLNGGNKDLKEVVPGQLGFPIGFSGGGNNPGDAELQD